MAALALTTGSAPSSSRFAPPSAYNPANSKPGQSGVEKPRKYDGENHDHCTLAFEADLREQPFPRLCHRVSPITKEVAADLAYGRVEWRQLRQYEQREH